MYLDLANNVGAELVSITFRQKPLMPVQELPSSYPPAIVTNNIPEGGSWVPNEDNVKPNSLMSQCNMSEK